MPAKPVITIDDHLRNLTPATRPLIEAALHAVRAVAPAAAQEVVYQSHPPSSPSTMWKLVRFRDRGENVVGIGAFPRHAAVFFYRGRELEDPSHLLGGGGKEMPVHHVARAGRRSYPSCGAAAPDSFRRRAAGLTAAIRVRHQSHARGAGRLVTRGAPVGHRRSS